ncbi:S8 family peptidase [Herbaspirillum sp. alder98]|uniref:S8 family peptidase n=1 Tax=Herbaspirillum sp. alder98 TaxID=2913096 RepID=UPI001CD88770|nr:S8 family peptidase [Herbaspirillum sp. alder98]MCA1322880.1 S8 family peptidase [Herbaspirillum sp. alder98]
MTGALLESDWEHLGLTVVSSDEDRTLVLFSSSDDMAEFRRRLEAYAGDIPVGQRNPAYQNFISTIEEIGNVEPRDRIGVRLREDGYREIEDFQNDAMLVLDLEIWDLGRRELRERKIEEITSYIEAMEGEVFDQYIGPSITLLRLRASGAVIRLLLRVEEVSSIDLPPEPDIVTGEAFNLEIQDLPPVNAIDDGMPVIGILDSGINNHPLIQDLIVGAIGVPPELGEADDFGHGTRVSGIAVFGDLGAQLASGQLMRGARLCSAKVVDRTGNFPERKLVASQMKEAITALNRDHGCRIFVIALADIKSQYTGGKVGVWAATLDELARDLDVLIVVSAGNRSPRGGNRIEQAVTEYPGYLLEPANRFYEPAGALNVLTVGSIAQGHGIDDVLGANVGVRPITSELEPSPFTRIGPGVEGSTKPDVVDIGGTLVYDPLTGLRRGENLPSAGVLTLHHLPLDRLFTSGSGTSYSAPLVAFKASQLLRVLPTASANLVRALLVGSASVPDPAKLKLQGFTEDEIRSVCGHGQIDLERAAYSDDARVVLYAEGDLQVDHFAVYHVPIPEPFQTENGTRSIRVTLAFDPPVRHSRVDYTGIGMNFRLLRGCTSEEVFEHYRRRPQDEGEVPEIPKKFNCTLLPGPQSREKSTVQTACATFKRDIGTYGDSYYLVVRCEGGWAAESVVLQRFALVVEIEHQAEVQLYQRVRARAIL